MKRNLFFTLLLLLTFSMCSKTKEATETKETKKETISDIFDTSKQEEQIEKYGVPTVEIVDNMEKSAKALYDTKAWEEAAEAYIAYAKNANSLANLLSQCVEPYYSASYDKKKGISYSKIEPFIPFEEKANEYKTKRNRACVKIGLCFKNTGDIERAANYLYKGLDLLDIDDLEYWTMASEALSELVGFTEEI